MAVPNRLMLSAELFEMYHGPYNEKEFQITMKCLTDCFTIQLHVLHSPISQTVTLQRKQTIKTYKEA